MFLVLTQKNGKGTECDHKPNFSIRDDDFVPLLHWSSCEIRFLPICSHSSVLLLSSAPSEDSLPVQTRPTKDTHFAPITLEININSQMKLVKFMKSWSQSLPSPKNELPTSFRRNPPWISVKARLRSSQSRANGESSPTSSSSPPTGSTQRKKICNSGSKNNDLLFFNPNQKQIHQHDLQFFRFEPLISIKKCSCKATKTSSFLICPILWLRLSVPFSWISV